MRMSRNGRRRDFRRRLTPSASGSRRKRRRRMRRRRGGGRGSSSGGGGRSVVRGFGWRRRGRMMMRVMRMMMKGRRRGRRRCRVIIMDAGDDVRNRDRGMVDRRMALIESRGNVITRRRVDGSRSRRGRGGGRGGLSDDVIEARGREIDAGSAGCRGKRTRRAR